MGLVPLEYHEDTLAMAAYLASKMTDQGVRDVHVFDEDGCELSEDELREAPPPPGWVRRRDL
jgi:hypothetical protein